MAYKKFIIAAGVVLAAVIGIGAVVHMNREDAALGACSERAPRIVAYGDSLVTGFGNPESSGFVAILSSKLGVPITNLGRNGDTTASALSRIDSVLREDPDIVVVLLGGNDALQRVPLEETTRNLDRILATLNGSGVRVVLVGVIGGFPTDPYRGMFEDLRDTYDAEYVPNVLSGLIGNPEYMVDQVHPNTAGHAKMAERVYPAVARACDSRTL